MDLMQLIKAVEKPDVHVTMGETFFVGIAISLMSMAVVIVILSMIALMITLLTKLDNKSTQTVKPKPESKAYEVVKKNEVIEEVQCEQIDNSEEIVAAITVAIAAAMGSSTSDIIVRKIVRTNNVKSRWENLANNMYN